MKRSLILIAPYTAWMILMSVLPQTAWAYAVRGIVAFALTFGCLGYAKGHLSMRGIPTGVAAGFVVFGVWILPEAWLWSSSAAGSSVYRPETCGMALTIVRLAASAFVISTAEELFFRKWLVEFAGFGWMLVLFGIEHMRLDLGLARGSVFIAEGVFAGFCYGVIAKKFGILSAIVAHATTNLVLGFYVIFAGKWFYWC